MIKSKQKNLQREIYNIEDICDGDEKTVMHCK